MKKIAIIGAGISGLYFANLLERNKTFEYQIFEKKNSIDLTDGYGIQLSVNSIKLLHKVGFNKLNTKNLYFPKKLNFFNARDLKKICDIDLSKFNDQNNFYTTLKRSNLVEFLLSGIPKDKLLFNCDLVDIQNKDRISLCFENFDISLYLGPNFHFVIYPINQNKEFNFISIIRKELNQEEVLNKDLFNDDIFIANLLNQISSKSDLNLVNQVEKIRCFPIFVSKKFQIPPSNNIFLIGDAFYSFPPSFAQGASQSIEGANDLFNDLDNNSSNYYKKRILRTKQINFRSKLNHFAFHLSNPFNVFFRNIFLKNLCKNKNFLENYLGKIYNN